MKKILIEIVMEKNQWLIDMWIVRMEFEGIVK